MKRCGVDYFNNYLLHNLNRERYENVQRLDGFDYIARKKAEGRVLHTGFSFHDDSALLEQILTDHPEVDFVQPDQLHRLGQSHHRSREML